ncbi:hypothetical protein KP509_36G029500 [Ceratopteris richardii]|uniref:Mitochondrial succinate-fumarate transporter 1 n=1 Tax=Ceratopteris richardii TaxID=49495 RepID=A0A8T2QAP0_CERRI|nr:hypothetical protein KP509_36G029500 [Ceratopteris richardii]
MRPVGESESSCFRVHLDYVHRPEHVDPAGRIGLLDDAGLHTRTPTHPPPFVKAVSGSIGGAVEACCLQPIDSIKTRIQLDTCRRYGGVVSCGKTIVQHEGIRALWKGLTPYSTHLVLKHTMRMGTNAILLGALRDTQTGHLSCQSKMVAGFGAGVSEALLIVTPCEVVKIRLQQQRGLCSSLIKYEGPIDCTLKILREEGVLGLWAGAAPTVMRNGINQTAMFTAKSSFDLFLWGKYEHDMNTLQPWQSSISGFLSGFLGPCFSCPFDVVKTRLMACASKQDGLKYKGMADAMKTIYQHEGLHALWKGLLPRLIKIPPGQAIMWTISDQVVQLYESWYR